MSESSLCQYCNQLQHFQVCDEARIALFESMKARAEAAELEVERLRTGFGQILRMYPDNPEYLTLAKLVRCSTVVNQEMTTQERKA